MVSRGQSRTTSPSKFVLNIIIPARIYEVTQTHWYMHYTAKSTQVHHRESGVTWYVRKICNLDDILTMYTNSAIPENATPCIWMQTTQ